MKPDVPLAQPQPARLPPPPPVPQLTRAPIANQSSHGTRDHDPGRAHPAEKGAALALAAPGALQKPGNHSNGPDGPDLTQSEQDFFLSQIMKYWHVNFHAPQAQGLVLQAVVYVQADGTLASPINKDDPWDPGAVIEGYDAMVRTGYSFRREAIEGFLLALRLCQPLELPPGAKGPWPRRMMLRFAFDDLP
jgi:hypothetical protein